MNELYIEEFLKVEKKPIDFLDTLLAIHKLNEDKGIFSFSFIIEDYTEEILETKEGSFGCNNSVVYIEFDKDYLSSNDEIYVEDCISIKGAIYNCWSSVCADNGETDGNVILFGHNCGRSPYFDFYDYKEYNKKYTQENINGDNLIYSAYIYRYAIKKTEEQINYYKSLLNYVHGEFSYLEEDSLKNFRMYDYLEKNNFVKYLENKYPVKELNNGVRKI